MSRPKGHVCVWKNPPRAQTQKEKEDKEPDHNLSWSICCLPPRGFFSPLECRVWHHLQGLKDFSFLRCCFVSRGFGTVCLAVENATGDEVSVKQCCSFCSSRVPSPLLRAVPELWVASRALLQRQTKCLPASACQIEWGRILSFSAAAVSARRPRGIFQSRTC